MPRVYLYVDGESHYIRAEKAWKGLYGDGTDLGDAQEKSHHGLVHIPEAKVFWSGSAFEDPFYGTYFSGVRMERPTRRLYFTAMVGDADKLHEMKLRIRTAEFEPHVVQEDKQLANQRERILVNTNVIEKAKGVDIGLTVTLLEDAHRDNFDQCHLCTSDIDYLPVIEAVRRLGKTVVVCGFSGGLGKNSPLLHVPDRFIDLDTALQNHLVRSPNSIV